MTASSTSKMYHGRLSLLCRHVTSACKVTPGGLSCVLCPVIWPAYTCMRRCTASRPWVQALQAQPRRRLQSSGRGAGEMSPCQAPPRILPDHPPATIYLTRHGESLNNLYGKIGGDASLSPRGEKYARALAAFVSSLGQEPQVWVTEYQRTQQTGRHLAGPLRVVPELGEIRAGAHDGLTYEQIAEQFPVEFALRDEDKLRYRYPGGESYLDVVQRIEPVAEELRRSDNLLVISHQATLRCLLACLQGGNMEEVPYAQIPLHTVLKVMVGAAGVEVDYMRLPVECVDTHRVRPSDCRAGRAMEQACLTIPAHL